MTLYDAAKDLHDFLWMNVPDLIEVSTSSEMAGEGLKKRLQALKGALAATEPAKLAEAAHDLLLACDMEQHNDDIFKGDWKKGSKAWNGDFVKRMRKQGMDGVRAALGARPPIVSAPTEKAPIIGVDLATPGDDRTVRAEVDASGLVEIGVIVEIPDGDEHQPNTKFCNWNKEREGLPTGTLIYARIDGPEEKRDSTSPVAQGDRHK